MATCFYGKGISLEGFDIAHSGPGAGAVVIQIQDLLGDPGGDDAVSNITLKNNILFRLLYESPFVIPAKAGIQAIHLDSGVRRYD